jgi:hypothetical protein
MTNPARRGRKTLNIQRSSEQSRLEEQLIAAAYELAAPILRRSLGKSAAAPQTQAGRPTTHKSRRKAGGSRA